MIQTKNTFDKNYFVNTANAYFEVIEEENKREKEHGIRLKHYKAENDKDVYTFLHSHNIISAVKENLKSLVRKYLDIFVQPKYPNLDLKTYEISEKYIGNHRIFQEEKLLILLNEQVIKNNAEKQVINSFMKDINGFFKRPYRTELKIDKYVNGKKLVLEINITSWKKYSSPGYDIRISNLQTLKTLGKVFTAIIHNKPFLVVKDIYFNNIDEKDFGLTETNDKYLKKFKIFKNRKFELEFDSEDTLKKVTDFIVKHKKELNV